MVSSLTDIDELILQCRDKKAKLYIQEAVACYKASAFRSAIVSTWIAVSFDLMGKFRELALAGDAEADSEIKSIDEAAERNDLKKSLQLERQLLVFARDNLQLISQTEFIDLERLQSDRNRCAHPSLTLEGGIFNPPAELARVHLRSAVEHLLQYPPAQGKYALSRILGELESDYFPTTKDEVLVVFKQSPLQNARESLVRNLVISIVKDLLFSVNDGHDKEKKVATLEAVNTMYPDIFVQTLNEKLSDVFRQLNDDVLYRVLPLLGNVPESWSSLGEDVRQKLDSYLGELPAEHVDEAIPLLDIQGLQEALECRLHRFSVQDFRDSFIMEMPAVLQDRLVDLYENSRSFEEANILSRDIAMQAKRFDEQRVERIVRACGENGQCAGSFEMPKVLVKLRENSSVSDEKIDRWLLEVGLREQVRKSDPLN